METKSRMKTPIGRELITILMSALVAGFISCYVTEMSADKVLKRHTAEGESILNSIGYVYFVTLFQTTDAENYSDGKVVFSRTPDRERNRAAYFQMLRQVQEDVRWLVGNQGYSENRSDEQPKLGELTALRSFLEIERALQSDSPLFGSLDFMCKTFGTDYHQHWVKSSQFLLEDSLYAFRPDGGCPAKLTALSARLRKSANALKRSEKRRFTGTQKSNYVVLRGKISSGPTGTLSPLSQNASRSLPVAFDSAIGQPEITVEGGP